MVSLHHPSGDLLKYSKGAVTDQVLLDDGVADAARPGTLIIDMSSAEPLRSRRLAEVLQGRGLRYVDAPVSGGVGGAIQGQLAIMVGGLSDDVDAARALFEVLGKSLPGHVASLVARACRIQ